MNLASAPHAAHHAATAEQALAAAPLPTLAPADWTELAACQYTDPEAFFPLKGDSATPARIICHRCPVITQCLRWALATAEPYGVLGGQSEQQRRALAAVIRAWVVEVGLPCPPRGPVPAQVQDAYQAVNTAPRVAA